MASEEEREPGRRRRYDDAFKQAVVELTLAPRTSVARIAREHDLNASQLFRWRRQWLLNGHFRTIRKSTEKGPVSLIPVTVEAHESDLMVGSDCGIEGGHLEVRVPGCEVRVRGVVDRQTFQVVLSILIFQDICAIFQLIFAASLESGGTSPAGSGLTTAVSLAGVKASVAFLAAVVLGRYAIRPLFRLLSQTRNEEIFTATGLLMVLATAAATSGAGL